MDTHRHVHTYTHVCTHTHHTDTPAHHTHYTDTLHVYRWTHAGVPMLKDGHSRSHTSYTHTHTDGRTHSCTSHRHTDGHTHITQTHACTQMDTQRHVYTCTHVCTHSHLSHRHTYAHANTCIHTGTLHFSPVRAQHGTHTQPFSLGRGLLRHRSGQWSERDIDLLILPFTQFPL